MAKLGNLSVESFFLFFETSDRSSDDFGFEFCRHARTNKNRNDRDAVLSIDKTAIWRRKAAQRGLAIAQFNLGWAYANGEGVPNDPATAVEWYRKAAVQGLDLAQYDLGWIYENGEGVPEDPVTAIQWYRRAAAQGNPDAEFALGIMYCKGEGVPNNPETALEWYRKAAEHGNADARVEIRNITTCKKSNIVDVHLRRQGGVLLVPVSINGGISLDFIIDSGASNVNLPADVVLTLMRTGTLTSADFSGSETYVLADGSKIPSQILHIRSLKIENFVLNNVVASVGSPEGPLLLGQSFLSRLKSWSIDNARQMLVLDRTSF